MNKKILKGIITVSIFLLLIIINNYVWAAGTFSLSKSSATITEGKTTTFKVNGSAATGKVSITSSDTSIATVSSSSAWLENSSETVTITAKKAGKATITVTGTVADKTGAEAEVTQKINVTVEAKKVENNTNSSTNTNTGTNNNSTTEKPKEKSNNAYLSTLGVTPKEYDFSGFKKNTTSYSVTVPYEIDSLKVLYKTADSNAKVKVTGNSGFEVGSNNKITIKVTAEDRKTTKTYTIKVTKLAEVEEKPGNIIEDEGELYLTKLYIDSANLSPEFSKDTYSYTATLNDSNIKDLSIEAQTNKENAKIEISGDKGLVEGENIVNILLTLDGSTVQAVYQVVVTAHFEKESTSGIFKATDLVGNIKNYVMIAIAVILLMIIAVIVLIVLLRKENKRLKNKEIIDDEKEEYNVYKNDENEFEDNSVKKEEIIEEVKEETNETETKNERKRTRRKEKGRHSK